jgi:hypothetical protein
MVNRKIILIVGLIILLFAITSCGTILPQEPDEPIGCCLTMTAECLACQEEVSVEEYCADNPSVVGCESYMLSEPEEPDEPSDDVPDELDEPSICNCDTGYYCANNVCLMNVSGNTYFVTLEGDDLTGDGSYENPWATWQHGSDQLAAGDILYIREGTYYLQNSWDVTGTSGTAKNPIIVSNYPGETPILDAEELYQRTGAWIHDINYWTFIGLTFQNAKLDGRTTSIKGVTITRTDNILFERCTSRNNEGSGFFAELSDNIKFINCDSYDNFNPTAQAPAKPGGAASGFSIIGPITEQDTDKWMSGYYYGCRSWNNSDNGYGGAYGSKVVVENSWGWNLGWQLFDPENPSTNGDGRGVPIGLLTPNTPPKEQHIIRNTIMAYNKGPGYHLNCNKNTYVANVHWHNNIAFYNREYGFRANYNPAALHVGNSTYTNNYALGHDIKKAWGNGDAEFAMEPGMPYTSIANSWEDDINISSDDFVKIPQSLEEFHEAFSAPRQADGSLPDLGDYFQLVEGSDLIDAGVVISGYHCETAGEHPNDDCLEWYGDAPDLGPFEYKG